MSETSVEKLKVFISWSKEPSREVAKSLRTGILTVFDMVQPFVSDVDIEAGDRALKAIEVALKDSGFGVIIVTRDNMEAPWLNFEAGALSKALGDDQTRVIPLLVGFTSMTQLTGPLVQFQARHATEEKILELFHVLGDQVGVSREIVTQRLSGWLPSFIETVELAGKPGAATPPKRSSEELLDELLDLVRGLRRDISASEPRVISTSRKTSEARRRALERAQLRSLLERVGIEELSVSGTNRHGDWVVELQRPVLPETLAMAREVATDHGFSVLFTNDVLEIVD